MIKLPEFSAAKARITRVLHPSTKWGRVALWSGGLSVLLDVLHWITRSSSDSALADWANFFTLIFAFCACWLTFRWLRRRVLWRLRHRLMVTYVFIGVIPIMLLFLIAGVAAYLFGGQFANYVVYANLQSELQQLAATNDSLATQLSDLYRTGQMGKQIAGEVSPHSPERFPQRTVTVWEGDQGFVLSPGGALVKAHPAKVPEAIKGDFAGLVLDGDSMHLRAVKRFAEGGKQFIVISNVPITAELLQPATSNIGSATLILPPRGGGLQIPYPTTPGSTARKRVETAPLQPSSSRFDRTFRTFTVFDVLDWETGKSENCALGVATKPSMLYSTLFATLGDRAKYLWYALIGIAVLLGLVELVALFIGIRLSRSITRAVAELYGATEHVNRGDLTHRIQIRGYDQLARLQQSFNAMTDSLVKLVAEQKQMQRMESELAIAFEVQDLLFPHQIPRLSSLDVYGVCHPARSVSGDYYDFIPLGTNRIVLAVGDISGKGISAALLMATAHAFVRAYSQEPDMAAIAADDDATSNTNRGMYFRGNGSDHSRLSTGMLMTTLNYQLFRCTPPEKYATMFLGCYDATLREMTYCNAGHLPPMIFSATGDVSRLDTSGTVVGLFDHATYGESTIKMEPGDLFVAFSDGVTESENGFGEFGEERLIALIQEHRHKPLSSIGDVIAGSAADWIGNSEQADDLTVVLARAH